MRNLRFCLAFGVLAAMACQQVIAAEPVGSLMGMRGLSSPYGVRDVGANGGDSEASPGTIVQTSAGLETQGYPGTDGLGGCYGCGVNYSHAGPGVYPPPMIGHFAVPYVLRGDWVRVINLNNDEVGGSIARHGRPVLTRLSYLITQGETPQPQTRAYLRYDYLEIEGSFPSLTPLIDKLRLETATLGFEQSFWDDHASVGIRVPFYRARFSARTLIDGNFLVDLIDDLDRDWDLGDVTLIAKCASGNFARTGKVCTIGIAATLPTGEGLSALDVNTGLEQDKHVGLLQPFVGYAFSWRELFVQGFSSVVFPLRSGTGDDVILWHNSIGVGYWLYGGTDCGGGCGHGRLNSMLGDGLITSIAPTLELQVNSALTNGGQFDYFRNPEADDSIFVASDRTMQFLNTVVISGGINVGISDHSWATIGGSIPLTKQPFDYQLVIQAGVSF